METGACGYGGQDCGGNKGVTIFEKPDETEDSPKPKLRRAREKENKSNAQIDFVFSSFDGAWNDPRYSTWNLLRQGSACTACHVTHWTGTIPTNSEISLIQVQGWRSLDQYTVPTHLAGLGIAISYANQAIAASETVVTSPDFVVSPNGDVVPVPNGATGPTPAENSAGFRYTGGSGGNGLNPRVSDVRIMNPTSKYPNGYISYSNASNQAVNPFTGQTVPRSSPWWHIPLSGGQ